MTSHIFPSCQQQNHEILRDNETCHVCGSPPWRPLPSFSASSTVIRRPQQPQVMQAPDPAIFTPTAPNPPTLGLASHLISSGGGRRRPPILSAPTSSTPHSALSSAPPSGRFGRRNKDPRRGCPGRGGCTGAGGDGAAAVGRGRDRDRPNPA